VCYLHISDEQRRSWIKFARPKGSEIIGQFLRYSSSKCYLTLLRRRSLNLTHSFASKLDGSSSPVGQTMFWRKKQKEKLNWEDIQKKDKELRRILAIIAYLRDGVLVFDKKNKLFLINPQAEKFLEVKGKQILGKSILELSSFPFIRPLVSLLGGEIREVYEKELPIKENLILEVSAIPMRIPEEKIGSLIILDDITQEKLAEEMKTRFVTLAAHQLRTPSSAVKWSMRTLLDGDLGKLTEKQKEMIEKTYQTNEKMISLIDDLLNAAKIEEGRYLTNITLSSIEQVIQSVIDSYQDEIKKRRLKFRFIKPEGEIPKVMLDVEKMKIAVTNIIDNALRYTFPGGRISVSVQGNKKEIRIQVQDNGIGIPQNQQKKIFTTFYRGSDAIKMETEGTGLGLFIAKNIIEAHKGKIWFESKEGKGATFYFTIPIKEKFSEFIGEEFY